LKVSFFKLSGCANRGLMAQQRSPFQPGRSEPGKSENWGRPSGGTDFLIARTGGDFNVPIKRPRGATGKKIYGDGQTEQKQITLKHQSMPLCYLFLVR
jgi:hypothetical protein